MTQTPQFRSRALAVREEARQRLLQVRQSRLAQKHSVLVTPAEPELAAPPEPTQDVEVAVAPEELDAPESEVQELAPPEASAPDLTEPAIASPEEAVTEPVFIEDDAPEAVPATEPSPPARARETPRKTPRAASTKAKPARPKPAPQPPSARGPAPRPDSPEDRSVLRAALAEMEAIAPPASDVASVQMADPEPDEMVDLPETTEAVHTPPEEPTDPVTQESVPEEWQDTSQNTGSVTLMAEPENDLEPAEALPPEDMSEMAEVGEAEAEVEAAAEPQEPIAEITPDAIEPESDASPEPEPEPAAPTPSDLLLLPGAAPGLVWLLQEMGVHNLRDLAQMEPDTLAAGLGIVGRILDVSIWTRFARAHLAQEGIDQTETA